jgi:hypothetical protein
MSPAAMWTAVRSQLELLPAGTVRRYRKQLISHPRDAGAALSLGWPVGQVADYRFAPESDCRGMHVQDIGDHWAAHLDRVHPDCSLLEHARQDAPQALFVGGALLGGLVAAAISNKRDATLAGACVGLLLAAVVHASAPDKT